ncbi:DNA-binding protein rif1, partial [Coemansia spiralis]
FECLTALEALLRRAPGATRQVYRAWLFPVLGLVANPVTGVRAKAGSIIRQNIPWVAADVHGPDMDALVKDFIATRLDQILTSATRLLGHGEHVLVARIWGMVIAVCARHCRGRLNDLLRVIQECFNSPSADVLVAALMQWRCLIYAFVLESRIHLHKCVQLVLTPIIKILEMTGTGTDVRLACVRCWVTLVYALGEEIGSHIDIISRVAGLVADDPCHEVRAVAARVLAALFNKFALAETSVAQFVIPRMVIGTTMLAASDGKSLSDTHGPFSSEVAYGGDHTLVLCKYVTGLGAGSPTVPVVADTAIRFIQQYMLAERRAAESCDPSTDRQSSLQRGFRSCGALCWGLAAAIRALGPTAAPQQRQLTVAITRAFVATLASDRACDPTPDPRYVCDYDCSPHALLYAALVDHLGDVLRQTRVDASELLCTACDPASAGAGHTCSALPAPCPPLAPTCFVALTGCHALWLGLQVRALANSESEDRRDAAAEDRLDAAAEAAAGHVRRLLPDRRDPDIGDSAATDDALVAMVVGSLIDAGSQPSAMRLALVQMFSRAADALRAAPSSPHAPFVLKAALFSGADGRDPELQRAREQALARLGAAASGPAFWPSALNALVDWVLDDQHLPGVYDLRLVYALCNGRGSKPDDIWDAKCCLGLATVVFGLEFGLPAADNADESVQELARTVRRETRDASNGLLQRLHSLLLPLVRAAVERIASDHADDTVRRARRNATAFVLAVVRGSTIKLTLTGDMPRDVDEEELDPTPEPEPMSESAREVAAAAERIVWACRAHQVAEPDTASVAPAEATPADGSALRKRTHLPESSDDDDGDDDRAPATEPAQTPPQRRRRKKRGKRRAPVSRSGSLSPSPSGVDDAEPDQLQAALDQLEATLHTAPPCSISRLLAVQARITGMQLWLCDAMRQGLDGA